MNGTSGGIVLFMNVDEIVMVNNYKFYNVDSNLYQTCAPTIKAVKIDNHIATCGGTPAPNVIIPGGDIVSKQYVQFALMPGLLSSNIIPPGMWDMHLWVRTAQSGQISLQWTLYFQDEDGVYTPNPFAASERVTITNSSLTCASEVVMPLYIQKPVCLCSTDTRILLAIKAFSSIPHACLSLYFESCSASFIRTTLVPCGPTGPTGAPGIIGQIGPMGPTGPTGMRGIDGTAVNTGATGLTGITGPAGPLLTQASVAKFSVDLNNKSVNITKLTFNGLQPNTQYVINWLVNEVGRTSTLTSTNAYLIASNVDASSFPTVDSIVPLNLNLSTSLDVSGNNIYKISGAATDTITTNASGTSITFTLIQNANGSFVMSEGRLCIELTKTLFNTTPVTTYTLIYNGNGNDGGNSPIDNSSPYNAGSSVLVLGNTGSPPLTNTGFTFNGWNTAADGSGTPYSPTDTFNINVNTTLYAQWV
jgi:hypothetical protein